MNPVKEIANSRFESMSLKDEKTSFQQSATSENVKNFAESIHLIDKIVDITQLKIYRNLEVFMDNQCHSTHYNFQVKNIINLIPCFVLFSKRVD